MRKNSKGWRSLDNTAKIFPVITNEQFSNVFRVSASLSEKVDPEILQKALHDVMPDFLGFRVRLRRGFFWYYFEFNNQEPLVEKETEYPCAYIDPHSSGKFLFRVSYYENRINVELFHAVTDGLGGMNFLKAITYRYLDLAHGLPLEKKRDKSRFESGVRSRLEDSYVKNYRKISKTGYSTRKALKLTGERLPLAESNVLHVFFPVSALKAICKKRNVSVTKYFTALMVWSVYKVYEEEQQIRKPIGVNLPINLRNFFGSDTMANFFAVVGIHFCPEHDHVTFDEILDAVCTQMDDEIRKDRMEEKISFNVSMEKKWYFRALPLCLKWLGINIVFRFNDRANTLTVSNIGNQETEEKYRPYIDHYYGMLGVSSRQPLKCIVCSSNGEMAITISSVFADLKLQNYFFGQLAKEGIPIEYSGNGVAEEIDRKSEDKKKYGAEHIPFTHREPYPEHPEEPGRKKPAAGGGRIVYLMSLLQALLILADVVTGYDGWSVNYAMPGIILVTDLMMVLMMVVDKPNWQNYLMYQLAMTICSGIPLILWLIGLVTEPVMTISCALIAVLALLVVIQIGDRSVKWELIRRFHM